jgi:hypothetical protein
VAGGLDEEMDAESRGEKGTTEDREVPGSDRKKALRSSSSTQGTFLASATKRTWRATNSSGRTPRTPRASSPHTQARLARRTVEEEGKSKRPSRAAMG